VRGGIVDWIGGGVQDIAFGFDRENEQCRCGRDGLSSL
jgi:hypothetical protein